MQHLRSVRWLLLALFLSVFAVSSHAQFSISANFGPPPLPVYEQPPCPEPGLMWTPGYWAWDPDQASYYWIPGAWVSAPAPGLLWTPGYWGWERGRFFFHEGYWAPHVGYYGGVNYGFGYGGIGFAGGEWHGDHFFYNSAVMHVDHRFVHETFEDRNRVERGFVERNNHVAFSGGPGGIRHEPGPEERFAEHDRHMDRSPFQHSHEQAAHSDRDSFANRNGGHPAHPFAERPLGADTHSMPMNDRNNSAHGGWTPPSHSQPAPQSQPSADRNNSAHGGGTQPNRAQPAPASRPASPSQPAPASRPAPQSRPAPAAQHTPKDDHKDDHKH